jgi:hypothetical protein
METPKDYFLRIRCPIMAVLVAETHDENIEFGYGGLPTP